MSTQTSEKNKGNGKGTKADTPKADTPKVEKNIFCLLHKIPLAGKPFGICSHCLQHFAIDEETKEPLLENFDILKGQNYDKVNEFFKTQYPEIISSLEYPFHKLFEGEKVQLNNQFVTVSSNIMFGLSTKQIDRILFEVKILTISSTISDMNPSDKILNQVDIKNNKVTGIKEVSKYALIIKNKMNNEKSRIYIESTLTEEMQTEFYNVKDKYSAIRKKAESTYKNLLTIHKFYVENDMYLSNDEKKKSHKANCFFNYLYSNRLNAKFNLPVELR